MRVNSSITIHISQLNLTVELGQLVLFEVAQPTRFALTRRTEHAHKDLVFSLRAVGSTQRQGYGGKSSVDVDDVAENATQSLL